MSALLEARDPYTHGHSRRVARHAERIAREIGLPNEQVAKIRAAALVHDIGKINIPRPILTKPGKLTDAEFAVVKRHPADGAAMVLSLGDSELTAIVRHHHERIDGTGYPDALAGEDIPVGARIIAVADTFDAITSSRAYRNRRNHQQALDVLRAEAGTQLDAVAVAAFAAYYASRRSIGFATVLAAAPQRLLSGLGGLQSGVAAGVAPIAQTACGVGGAVLVVACFGGSALPNDDDTSADRAKPQGELAAQTVTAPNRPVPTRDAPAREQRRERTRSGEGAVGTPTDESAPRPLRTPADAEEPGPGGGGGGGVTETVDNAVPDSPELPALPDVQTVLDQVNDVVQLPQLRVPAPVPQPQLPQDLP
jgi:putative nucleotidyltransferase with HDIG domain